MWYLIIIFILLILIYFKKKSKSKFFLQNIHILSMYRKEIKKLLQIKNRTAQEVNLYLSAYDFFCLNVTKYDGATFVKDLYDIPNLDLDAMLHDYECLIGANRNYKSWGIAVWNYYENQRKQGKGNRPGRLVGLLIIGLFFIPYCYLFTPKYKL